MMPEMNGIEATARIRALGEGKSPANAYYTNVPIIALTANAVSGTKEMFITNGFNDFLSKPIDTVKLKVILGKWLPKEKQKVFTHERAQDRATQCHSEVLADKAGVMINGVMINIKGIDVCKGLSTIGGKIDNYLRALSMYYDDGYLIINEIKNCLSNKNINLFTTHIHGFKSASAIIGADELSAAAKSLEMAGMRMDTNYIYENTGAFLKNLEALLSSIYEALLIIRDKKDSIPIDLDTIKSELIKLKTAFENYDIDVITESSKKIKGFVDAPGIGDSIALILKYKLTGKYNEAILLIEKVINEMEGQEVKT